MKKQLILAFVFISQIALFAQDAPNFTITSSDGETIQLYEDLLNQNKTVLLKFFFTSCPPCNGIAPLTETLYQDWGGNEGDVEFISLSIMGFDNNADVADFKNTHSLTYPGAGIDGGALDAVQPYTAGTFGGFGGTPIFAVIAPDKSVQFNVKGSNYANTIIELDAAIAATGAQKPMEAINYLSAGGSITTPTGRLIEGATVDYTTETTSGTIQMNPYSLDSIPENTFLELEANLGGEVTNGVTTFDLVLITKHILGIEMFENPYQAIAADADNSGHVTTFDVILLRRLILDIISELPESKNWVILPTSFDELSSNNIPTNTSYLFNTLPTSMPNLPFTAIKLGDVNDNADVNAQSTAPQK